jgi:DNA-binding CsgD family transcriptional regulator
MALELKIQVATVRTHARAVFRKTGVKARHELVGMVHSDGPPFVVG